MSDSTEVKNIISMIKNAKTLSNELKGEIIHLLERKYKTKKHKQVKLYCPFYREEIEVDEKLKELLDLIWENDIMTVNSCQDNPLGYIWINFDEYDDFNQFMKIVANKLDIDSLNRVLTSRPIKKDDWIFNMHLMGTNDNNFDSDDESEEDGVTKYDYDYTSFSVRFPHSDLQYVINKLRYNL